MLGMLTVKNVVVVGSFHVCDVVVLFLGGTVNCHRKWMYSNRINTIRSVTSKCKLIIIFSRYFFRFVNNFERHQLKLKLNTFRKLL